MAEWSKCENCGKMFGHDFWDANPKCQCENDKLENKMIKQNIGIQVIGRTGTGKSTIIKIIENALREKGFDDIQVNDEDNDKIDEELITKRIDALNGRISIMIDELYAAEDYRIKPKPIVFDMTDEVLDSHETIINEWLEKNKGNNPII